MPAKQIERFSLDRLETPIGIALLVTDDEGFLRALDWSDYESRLHRLLKRHYGAFVLGDEPAPKSLVRALKDYFAGDIDQLAAIKWRTGGTSFQRNVWTALQSIPAGRTFSYGELAVRLSVPNGARAVGLANGANPISVVVPCHRLIGADGSLTGYAGGLKRKQWLLQHEGASLKPTAQ